MKNKIIALLACLAVFHTPAHGNDTTTDDKTEQVCAKATKLLILQQLIAKPPLSEVIKYTGGEWSYIPDPEKAMLLLYHTAKGDFKRYVDSSAEYKLSPITITHDKSHDDEDNKLPELEWIGVYRITENSNIESPLFIWDSREHILRIREFDDRIPKNRASYILFDFYQSRDGILPCLRKNYGEEYEVHLPDEKQGCKLVRKMDAEAQILIDWFPMPMTWDATDHLTPVMPVIVTEPPAPPLNNPPDDIDPATK